MVKDLLQRISETHGVDSAFFLECGKRIFVEKRRHSFCEMHLQTGSPLGNRILTPIPSALRHMRSDPTVAKVLAIATKFV